jgi:hypothetical protein
MKNCRIPSSFLPSCRSTNFMSVRTVRSFRYRTHRVLLPGVTYADTVHSLNLSIALKYLIRISTTTHSIRYHIHQVLFPHLIFDNIQTRIRNHLYHMPVLSSPYAHRPSARVLCGT